MKIITERMSKTKRVRRIPAAAKIHPGMARMTGRQLIRWLKIQGAEPVDAQTKRRLQAAGHWGMPQE